MDTTIKTKIDISELTQMTSLELVEKLIDNSMSWYFFEEEEESVREYHYQEAVREVYSRFSKKELKKYDTEIISEIKRAVEEAVAANELDHHIVGIVEDFQEEVLELINYNDSVLSAEIIKDLEGDKEYLVLELDYEKAVDMIENDYGITLECNDFLELFEEVLQEQFKYSSVDFINLQHGCNWCYNGYYDSDGWLELLKEYTNLERDIIERKKAIHKMYANSGMPSSVRMEKIESI